MPWVAVLALAGCPAASPAPVPPADPDPQVQPHPRDVGPPAPVVEGDAGAAALAAGEPCFEAADCASGVCEGQGCGADQPGTCAPERRACTRDLRPYCGCDGQTFRTSGSCPGRRFSHRGECELRAGGTPCLRAEQCASGVCEGLGCGDDQPGTCALSGRRCTADLVEYCACDGQTFQSSSSCPGRRFSARRACEPASE